MPRIADIERMSDDEFIAYINGQGSLTDKRKPTTPNIDALSDDEFIDYLNSGATSPKRQPALQPPASKASLGGVVSAIGQGLAEGVTTEIPAMVGAATEFVGSYLPGNLVEDVGRDIKTWAETKRKELYGPEKKREGLERWAYEGTKMLAPSILPAGIVNTGVRILSGVGKLVKAGKMAEAAGDAAKAAEFFAEAQKAAKQANNIASGSVAGLFGGSQAQNTRDNAELQAKKLEAKGDYEGARKAREAGQGAAPIISGAIEAGGEFFGTKYLGKLFRLDEADVAKRGAKELVSDFIKTLGVEVSTEMGQQGGEAAVEKYSGIRPEADPLAEALDVIGPTAFMTLITGGAAGAINTMRRPTDSIDLMQEAEQEKQPDLTETIRQAVEQVKKEELKPKPDTAREAAEVFFGPEAVENEQAIQSLQQRGLYVPEERPVKSAEESAQAFEQSRYYGAPATETREPETGPVLGQRPQEPQPAAPAPAAEEKPEFQPWGQPSTAEEAAQVFMQDPEIAREDKAQEALKRRGLEVPEAPFKSAQESAQVFASAIDEKAHEAATSPLNERREPTEPEKKAGNYKKGPLLGSEINPKLAGLEISIENPQGSERSGKDKDGKPWSITMNNHYGYIRETQGRDKDHIDVFIGNKPESDKAYIVDQVDPTTGKFDEHKVILAASDIEDAQSTYLSNYEPSWQGLGAITEMPVEEFKTWVKDGRKTKPVAFKETKGAGLTVPEEKPAARTALETPATKTGDISPTTDEISSITQTAPLTVFQKMPDAELEKQAKAGVKGAKTELAARKKKTAQGSVATVESAAPVQSKEVEKPAAQPAPEFDLFARIDTLGSQGKSAGEIAEIIHKEQPDTNIDIIRQHAISRMVSGFFEGDKGGKKLPEKGEKKRAALKAKAAEKKAGKKPAPVQEPEEDNPRPGMYESVLGMARAMEGNLGRPFSNIPTEAEFNGAWRNRQEGQSGSDVFGDLLEKMNPEPKKPSIGANNKFFTEDKANRAREILRKKLGGVHMGVPLDPEIIQAGIDLAGYYIESGARKFKEYSVKMIADLGEAIRPYLKSFYLAVRNYPGFDNAGMNSEAELEKPEAEDTPAEKWFAITDNLGVGNVVRHAPTGKLLGHITGLKTGMSGAYVTTSKGGSYSPKHLEWNGKNIYDDAAKPSTKEGEEPTAKQAETLKVVGDRLQPGDYVDKNGDIRLSPERRQEIMAGFFKGKERVAADQGQALIFTGGPPGAGKTTSTKGMNLDKSRIVESDADEIKRLAGYASDLAPLFHEESSAMNKEIARRGIAEGYNVIYDSLLQNFTLIDSMIQDIIEKGGLATIAFTDIDAVTSQVRSRVRAAETTRIVKPEVSVDSYNHSLPALRAFYEKYKGNPQVDFALFDNNVDDRKAILVFRQESGKLTVYDQDLFDKFKGLEYKEIEKGGAVRYERQNPYTAEELATQEPQIRERVGRRLSRINGKAGDNASESARKTQVSPEEEKENVDETGKRDTDAAAPKNDRDSAEGPGPENVPTAEGGETTAGVPGREGRAPVGELPRRDGTRVHGTSGNEGLAGTHEEPARSGPEGVGSEPGNVPRIQRSRPRRGTDLRIQPGDLTRTGSWRDQAKANLDAIELVKRLEAEGRQATPEEQKLLAKYAGWGASELANNMFPGYAETGKVDPDHYRIKAEWKPLVKRLVDMLTPEEIKTAARSTQYAHYTSESVIRSIYRAMERFGFPGGKILEPGMGTGHFFGLLPDNMLGNSVYTGIEFDGITAGIAKYLYPNQHILLADYTKQKLPNNFFDLAIGNPPFAPTKILSDPDYKKFRFPLHDYFFAKSMDKVRPGGLLVFITSRYSMDKQGDKARKYLAERADLMGAIRLPQTAFKHNAGTEVVTDILFLRKKSPGESSKGEAWEGLKEIQTDKGPAMVNEYFADHPEMVLGKHALEGSMYSKNEYTVLPLEGDIEAHFSAAVEKLPANVFSMVKAAPAEQKQAAIERDFNPLNKKEGGLYVSDKGKLMVVDMGSGVPLSAINKKIADKEEELKKINSRLGAPFEFEQELNEKIAEVAQIETELTGEGSGKEVPDKFTELGQIPELKKLYEVDNYDDYLDTGGKDEEWEWLLKKARATAILARRNEGTAKIEQSDLWFADAKEAFEAERDSLKAQRDKELSVVKEDRDWTDSDEEKYLKYQDESIPAQFKIVEGIIKSVKGGQETLTPAFLYSGVDITQTLNVLRGLRDNIKLAMPHLENLGRAVYESGARTRPAWWKAMRERLGDLWNSFKDVMAHVWDVAKNTMGNERGAITLGGPKRQAAAAQSAGSTARATTATATAPTAAARPAPAGQTPAAARESRDIPGMLKRSWDELRFQVQDKFHYLNKAQTEAARRARRELPESQDAYLAETRYHGMAAAAIDDFEERHVTPLITLMSRNNISVEQAGEYLHARHAREANEYLRQVNPEREDNEALSGMTDEEAALVLNRIRRGTQAQAYEEIGRKVDAITKARRDLLVEAGLETAETIDTWEQTYSHYVPLMREGKGAAMPRRGRGYDVRGGQKIRGGSEREVVNILANVVAQHEATIVRAEKAKVSRAFLEFAKKNPGPWKIDTPERVASYDSDGLITYRANPIGYLLADNVLAVRIDGKDHHITFDQTNLDAMRICSAMKNLDAADMGALVRAVSKVSRWLAMVNTALNPEFIISNFARDIQTAAYNMSDSEADAIRMKAIKQVGSAFKGIRDFQGNKRNTEWAGWFNRFRNAGGQTGWLEAYGDIQEREKDLISKIENMKPGKVRTIKRGLQGAFDYISDMNTAVENAIRLSVFKNLVENNIPESKAARIAKELTVNFNRRGNMGPVLNTFYLFYNASVQGSSRLIMAAAQNRKVRKLMAATVVLAAVLDIMNRASAGDDDDGENRYDKISPWVKERNLIIMLPGSKGYIQIPLPWGYNVFHVMGQAAGEVLTKKNNKLSDSALRVGGAVVSAFNPVGGESSILQMISPTLTDPFVQWAENKDWSGRKLRPSNNVFAERPSSMTYWKSVREPSRWIAQQLNELTGGDEVRPGKIDISPEAFDLAIDTFTGGAGKFVSNLVSAPLKAAKGEDLESYEIPFLRRVYGQAGKQVLTQNYYKNMDAVRLVDRQLDHYENKPDKVREIIKEYRAEYSLIDRMKATQDAMKGLRDQMKSVDTIKDPQIRAERKKKIEQTMEKVMNGFNKNYNAVKGKEK